MLSIGGLKNPYLEAPAGKTITVETEQLNLTSIVEAFTAKTQLFANLFPISEHISDREPTSLFVVIGLRDLFCALADHLPDFEVDFVQMESDREFVVAALTIGSAFLTDSLNTNYTLKGGGDDDDFAKAHDQLMATLNNCDDMNEIAIAIQNYVSFEDEGRSTMIGFDSQDVIPLLRYVIASLAVGSSTPNTSSLVTALTGGLCLPTQGTHRVNATTFTTQLRKIGAHNLTELLLCNIINKRSPMHSIYNACYLHCVNTNTNFDIIGVVGRLDPQNTESRRKLLEECEWYIYGVDDSTDDSAGEYDVFTPIPKLLLHDVVQGSLLTHLYLHMKQETFESVKKIIATPEFSWTIRAFTRILPRKSDVYEQSPVRNQLLFTRPAVDPTTASSLYDVFYVLAHGAMMNRSSTIGRNVSNNVTVLVPDNLVIVRVGMVGHLTWTSIFTGKNVRKRFCEKNLNLLALLGELEKMGCDIVPPGYPVQNMTLGGYGNTYTYIDETTKQKHTIEDWNGIFDCTAENFIQISFKNHNTTLERVMSGLGNLATERGRKALVFVMACHKTYCDRTKREGQLANVQALNDLPVKIYTTITKTFEPHAVIELSTEIRTRNKQDVKPVQLKLWELKKDLRRKRKPIPSAQHPNKKGGRPPSAATIGLAALFLTVALSLVPR